MPVVATDQGEKDSWGREFILGFMNAAPPTDTEITEITDMTLTLTTLVDADVTVRITSNAANVTSNLQLSTTVRRGAHTVGNMCPALPWQRGFTTEWNRPSFHVR